MSNCTQCIIHENTIARIRAEHQDAISNLREAMCHPPDVSTMQWAVMLTRFHDDALTALAGDWRVERAGGRRGGPAAKSGGRGRMNSVLEWLGTRHRVGFVISRRYKLGAVVAFHALTLRVFTVCLLRMTSGGWACAVAVPFVDVWFGRVTDEPDAD